MKQIRKQQSVLKRINTPGISINAHTKEVYKPNIIRRFISWFKKLF